MKEIQNNPEPMEAFESIDAIRQTTENKPVKRRRKRHHILLKLFVVVLTLALLAGGIAVGAGLIVTHGPSRQARILFVRTWDEMGLDVRVPALLLSPEEVTQILEKNVVSDPETGRVPMEEGFEVEVHPGNSESASKTRVWEYRTMYQSGMILEADPKLVDLAVTGADLVPAPIQALHDVSQVSAGLSVNEATPNAVVCNGQILKETNEKETMLGLTSDGILMVGAYTAAEAKAAGMTDAVSCGKILIENGLRCPYLDGGCLARTAIGQKADGRIVIAVIRGLPGKSVGMTWDELAVFMQEQGCVTAACIADGERSVLYLDGRVAVDNALFAAPITDSSCVWILKGED